MTETHETTGGWALTLTCPCGHTDTYRAVVPGLLLDAVRRDGWWTEHEHLTGYEKAAEGICGPCQRVDRSGAA